MTIFIKLDRLSSVKRLRRRFFINFISEKFCSADVVEMGIDKHIVASLCRLGNNAISMSLVVNPSVAWIYHLLAADDMYSTLC